MIYQKRIFLFLLLISFNAFSQSKEQVIDDHLQAMHQSFWQNITTVEADGSFHLKNHEEVKGVFKFKTPDKWKFEDQKRKTMYAFNGTIAWRKTPDTESRPTVLEKDMTLILSSLAFFGSPISQLELNEINFRGLVNVDKISCYWLVHEKKDITKEYFIVKETGRLFRTIISIENIKEIKEFSISYLNYRDFSGIPFPTLVRVKSNDLTMECVMHEIVLGGGMSNQIFDWPQM